MKLKNFALLFVFVMLLAGQAFAEYRTGSDIGDAVVYGAGGAVIGVTSTVAGSSGAASFAAWAITIVCPPAAVIGVAAGTGALIYGSYGYYEPNKTLKKDLLFAGVTAVASPVAAKYVAPNIAWKHAVNGVKSVGSAVLINKAQRYKEYGEKVDLRNPTQAAIADWAY